MCIYFQAMLALYIDQQTNKIGKCVKDICAEIRRDVMRWEWKCDIDMKKTRVTNNSIRWVDEEASPCVDHELRHEFEYFSMFVDFCNEEKQINSFFCYHF